MPTSISDVGGKASHSESPSCLLRTLLLLVFARAQWGCRVYRAAWEAIRQRQAQVRELGVEASEGRFLSMTWHPRTNCQVLPGF